MAIEFTPDDVASGYNLTKLNNNFDKVDTALQDALSRSGNGPNQMEADIDLNSNDLLNVKNTFTESLVLNGGVVTPEELVTLPPIVMTKPVYDPQGIVDDAFDRANHTGTQSIVTLTDWQPEYSFRRYVTQAQWDDILDGTQTAHLSVELQEAEDDVSSKGGGRILYPAGVIPIDGFKGAEASFNVNRRGGLYLKGGVHHVGVKGKTIWRNIANDWRCIVSAREASDWSIKDIILDGDRYNHPNAVLASDSIRGEGIIFWGFTENLKNVRIEGVETRNMGHYGIGVQSVEIDGLDIIGCYGYDCGGDFIDIKDYPALNLEKTGIRIIGNTARRIGTNWQERVAEGAGPQAGFDIRGACLVANNYVFDLDSYDVTQVGNDGVRVNADVTSESRKGGARSLLINNWVRSVKLDSEGSGSVKRIRGLVVSDENVSVNGHYNENCFIGTIVTNSGDSIANRSTILGVTNKNCKGAAADGIGTQIGSGTLGHKLDVTNVSCDIGFTCNGTASSGRITNTNCTLGNNLSVTVMSLNNFSFNKASNSSNSTVDNAQHNFAEELTVWGETAGNINLRSTFNGTWTTPFESSGINVYKEDTSGAGAGLAAFLRSFFTGATGAGMGWRVAATDGVSAPITIVDFRGDRTIWNNALIPNFADDAAASAGGVPIGGMYRTTSTLKVRVA